MSFRNEALDYTSQYKLHRRDLNLTLEYPSVFVNRKIYTPWPIVLAHSGLAILLVLFQIQRYKLKSNSVTITSIVIWISSYLTALILCFGSIVLMIKDLVNGGRTFSVGVAQNFYNFWMLSTAIPMLSDWNQQDGSLSNPLGYSGRSFIVKLLLPLPILSFLSSGLGFVLFTFNGILSIMHNRFINPHIRITVYNGCPNGINYNLTGAMDIAYCPTVLNNWTYYDTTNDMPGVLGQFLWIYGVIFFVIMLMIGFISVIKFRQGHFLPSSWFTQTGAISNNTATAYRTEYRIILMITVFTCLVATIDSAVSCLNETETVWDCSQATWNGWGWIGCNKVYIRVNGSYTGFLNLWKANEEEIVRTIFVW